MLLKIIGRTGSISGVLTVVNVLFIVLLCLCYGPRLLVRFSLEQATKAHIERGAIALYFL